MSDNQMTPHLTIAFTSHGQSLAAYYCFLLSFSLMLSSLGSCGSGVSHFL